MKARITDEAQWLSYEDGPLSPGVGGQVFTYAEREASSFKLYKFYQTALTKSSYSSSISGTRSNGIDAIKSKNNNGCSQASWGKLLGRSIDLRAGQRERGGVERGE